MAEATLTEPAVADEAAARADQTARPSHPPQDDAPERIPAVRRWATGWTTGLAQTLGAALLLISEFIREDVAALGEKVRAGTQLPSYAADFPHLQRTLEDQGWYRFVHDAQDALTVHEPRAALWAAVWAALVVRFNKDGPPRVQLALSLLSALYCVVQVLAGIPYAALAGFALPCALVLAAVAMATVTRRSP